MSEIDRYEVIAEYPSSIYFVGDIIEVSSISGMAYITEIDDCSEKYDVRDFPNLFKLKQASELKGDG